MYDYVRFEVNKTNKSPPGYRTVADRRAREKWPAVLDGWPTTTDQALIALYPPAAAASPPLKKADLNQRDGPSRPLPAIPPTEMGVNSYYMVLGVLPRPGTMLHQWIGNGWVIWCIQQVAEVVEGSRMVGWVHRSTAGQNILGHMTPQIEDAIKAMAAKGDPMSAQAMRNIADQKEKAQASRGSW
ncbi:MAG: hypothetical protein GY772_06480 [bacterium]|nr:hypothetical protein [bacterium]